MRAVKRSRGLPTALLIVAIGFGAPGAAQAEEPWALNEFMLGTSCAVLNLVYGPAKVGYAVLGTAIGGAAWLLTGGRRHVARAIIQPALRGAYMIVPANLTLEQPLEFYGRSKRRSGAW